MANENDYGKVMEREKVAKSHGIFTNFQKVMDFFYNYFFANLIKLVFLLFF